MDDLISRKALANEVQKYFVNNNIHKNDLAEAIAKQPTVEANPIVYGEWEDDPQYWKCNQCHTWLFVFDGDADMNFCPNCGADMRKKVEE